MEEIIKILNEIRPDIDFASHSALIDDEILDSFDIISIVGELNDVFDIEIGVDSLTPENFNSAQAMHKLVTELSRQ